MLPGTFHWSAVLQVDSFAAARGFKSMPQSLSHRIPSKHLWITFICGGLNAARRHKLCHEIFLFGNPVLGNFPIRRILAFSLYDLPTLFGLLIGISSLLFQIFHHGDLTRIGLAEFLDSQISLATHLLREVLFGKAFGLCVVGSVCSFGVIGHFRRQLAAPQAKVFARGGRTVLWSCWLTALRSKASGSKAPPTHRSVSSYSA